MIGWLAKVPFVGNVILYGLMAVAVAGAAATLWYRGEYHGCQAEAAADKLAQAKAVQKAKDDAQALSDELIIAQAQAMAVTEKKVVTFVDKIHNVPAAPTDAACAANERNKLGSRGVSDLIHSGGSPAVSPAPAAVPGPRAGARP